MKDFFLTFNFTFYVLLVFNFFAHSALGRLIKSAPYAQNVNMSMLSFLDSLYGLAATCLGFYIWYLFNWKYFLSYSLFAIVSMITYNLIISIIHSNFRQTISDYLGLLALVIQPICLGVLWYYILTITK